MNNPPPAKDVEDACDEKSTSTAIEGLLSGDLAKSLSMYEAEYNTYIQAMMDVKVDTTQNVWDDYYDYLEDTNLNLQTIDLDTIDAEGISEITHLLKLENEANASVFRVRRLMMQAHRHMDKLRTLAKRIDEEHGLELEKKAHVVNVELFRQYTKNVQKHFVVLLEPWRAVVYGRAAKVFDKEEG
ncbi:hypothetical protein D6C85_07380 [Aureobasidium pullulans]|uniref:Uncharacterized protein n=2 Tax=Aureobasidium pullulans TaxID=5580 RepID=A0A074XBD5_AURPU|nr:uncharacterized protein M438DRAFT_338411 [Aureobasidium pullulans EXF-150]KEQ81034.1 hypothetical protein M438DRAFT_338411 [Aureobasidium pullulans EXF-150]THY14837.1 hypothetical protein D6D00_09616 [Aureobasidium pullulans]THZ68592.1 hypothetical protein D6C85_07380 [Aureobasidium pullulans]